MLNESPLGTKAMAKTATRTTVAMAMVATPTAIEDAWLQGPKGWQ
jgi:hypothetical protein